MSLPLTARISLLAAAVSILTGCTQVQQSFPDRSAEEVWFAVRAVAEEPRYDDWHVIENHVYVDDDARRVEIYRELRRDLAMPATRIQREDRTYRFRLVVVDGPPPEARFTSRGWAVPAHAHTEGTKFLDEVKQLLTGTEPGSPPPLPASRRETTEPARDATPAPTQEPAPSRPAPPDRPAPPPVDIDLD